LARVVLYNEISKAFETVKELSWKTTQFKKISV
jgi:hypothetical protein